MTNTQLLDYAARVARRYVRGATAEDVVQDAMIRLIQHPYDPSLGRLEAYVRVIVRNLAIDTIRKEREFLCGEMDDGLYICTVTPEDHVSGDRELRHVLANVRDARDRKLLVLSAYGYEGHELGIAVGLSRAQAHVRLCRARKRMRGD